MTDKELLDWLEKQEGLGLISDDAGRWAVSTGGIQNVPESAFPIDIASTFFVEKEYWKSTIKEAIEEAIKKEDE